MEYEPNEMKYLTVRRESVIDNSSHTSWASKRLVWVPDTQQGYVSASIKEEKGEEVKIQVLETGRSEWISKDDVQKMNPPKFRKAEDMAELTCLNEAAVLYNLKERYYSSLIYTYSGLFCVVINPYKNLPIYNDQIIKLFKGKKRHEVPPHIFALTDVAYRSMISDNENQSILCTGESGSGKTENTKKVIQYLTSTAGSKLISDNNDVLLSSSIKLTENSKDYYMENQLLKANPVLESFGNARTLRNNNSSRFGKFIRIRFDASGFICGANIETYLLEKSRTVRQERGERSFHIFYYLLSGCPKIDRDKYLLQDIKDYKFLTNESNGLNIPTACTISEDMELYKHTIEAMRIMQFSQDEIDCIHRVVSAILLFGNVKIESDRNSEAATLPDDTVAQKICYLLGLNVTEMAKALLRPKLKVGHEYVVKSQTKEQAAYTTEAISKSLYEKMFKWIVIKINKTLDKSIRSSSSFIGILDISGFEIYKSNSFEQLCINYTNERLQQLFNHTMFILEQDEYSREGITWKFIDFGLDLQPTIDLLEKQMGIFTLINEQCWFPKATDKSLADKIILTHKTHPKFKVPDFRDKADFSILHYAGKVDYSCKDWLTKNMDPLNENMATLLQESSDEFIKHLWISVYTDITVLSSGGYGIRTRKGMFRTLGQSYKEQLISLMETLGKTRPNFLRCIIPNNLKKPGKIDSLLVLDQLKCNGVLEGIRICRQGFPNRILFQEFKQRYEILTPGVIPSDFMDGKQACELILNALELDKNLYRVGQSKLFFRAGILANLEEERDLRLGVIFTKLQAYCRGYVARRMHTKRLKQINAVRILQRNYNAYIRLRNWKWWRLFTKVRPLIEIKNNEEKLIETENELRRVSDKFQFQSNEVDDLRRTHKKLVDKNTIMSQQMNADAQLTIQVEEALTRITSEKNELEVCISQMEGRIEEDNQKYELIISEKDKLLGVIQDLEEQLEEEEQNKQKLQLTNINLENQFNDLMEESKILKNNQSKHSKEKSVHVKKMEEYQKHIENLNESIKHMQREKCRIDEKNVETSDRLKRSEQLKTELEKQRRRLENELGDSSETLKEKYLELENHLKTISNQREELECLYKKGEEECVVKEDLKKCIRNNEFTINELKEDLSTERDNRVKAEKVRRDLGEELEALKSELEDSVGDKHLINELRQKREQEVVILKRNQEDENKKHQEQLFELRKTYNQKVEELSASLEKVNRQLIQSEKQLMSSNSEKNQLESNIKKFATEKSENEKRKKDLEYQINELTYNLNEIKICNENHISQINRFKLAIDEKDGKIEEYDIQLTELNKKNSKLLNTLSDLEMHIEELNSLKSSAESARKSSDERLQNLMVQFDEINDSKGASELKLAQIRGQMSDVNCSLSESKDKVKELNEQKRKLGREVELLLQEVKNDKSEIDRLSKSKKKTQSEFDDIVRELDEQRSANIILDKKQRKFDQNLADERLIAEKIVNEKDLIERQCRDSETKCITLQREIDESNEKCNAIERLRMNLQAELDDMISSKDDVGKNYHELEKLKKNLEMQIDDQNQQIEEMEDEIQILEDCKLRMDVNEAAIKSEYEKNHNQLRNQMDEQRMQLQKQLKDLEAQLHDEKTNQTSFIGIRRKLESDLSERVRLYDQMCRENEELNKINKKYHSYIREVQKELDDTTVIKDDYHIHVGSLEKRIESLDNELQDVQRYFEISDKERRTLKAQNTELMDDVKGFGEVKSNLISEQKRMKNEIINLEEELEDEHMRFESIEESYKKIHAAYDISVSDLNRERSKFEEIEATCLMLTRKNKELRNSLIEEEENNKNRSRLVVEALEVKCNNFQEQLEIESRERQISLKMSRRFERKLKDVNVQCEESQRSLKNYQDQLEKSNSRIRTLNRKVEEHYDEYTRECNKNRKIQRNLDEYMEKCSILQREIETLRNRRKTYGIPFADKMRNSRINKSGFNSYRSSNLTIKSNESEDSMAITDDVNGSSTPTTSANIENPNNYLNHSTISKYSNTKEYSKDYGSLKKLTDARLNNEPRNEN
ncbi:Myosin heavy chain 11 [Intoshia linei]|uniref:Myosin heavy chain 11 n=1 Tax=Intoshia linei TaxID=1819745 RepID=A0A177B7U1_9BILA|nr:Myosin heavy chain 11 [Intoshia linei]